MLRALYVKLGLVAGLLSALDGCMVESEIRFLLRFRFAQCLLGVRQLQLRFLSFDLRNDFLLAGLESRRLHGVTRLQYRGRVSFFHEARLSTGLIDSRLRGFQGRPELRQILLGLRLIELNHNVAGFHHRTFRRHLDDLQFPRIRRRADRYRLKCLHLAAELHRVEKLSTLHFDGRNRRRSLSQPYRSHYNAASRQDEYHDRHRLALHRQLLKAFDHYEPLPGGFAPLGASFDPALCFEISTSTAAERSGINLGSFPAIDTMTTNERSLLEKSPPSPIGAS